MAKGSGFPAIGLTLLLMVVGVTTPAQGVLNENKHPESPAEKRIAENKQRIHDNEVELRVTERLLEYQKNYADSLKQIDSILNQFNPEP